MKKRQGHALSVALDLLRIPSKVRSIRSAPLPSGMLLLLRLAAEESDAQAEAAQISKRAQEDHRDAAIFFIEQVLLSSDADAYRVLGLDGAATMSEIRRHMVYLLKWLHPDRTDDPHRARQARRVLLAWEALKSRERADNQNSKREGVESEEPVGRRTRARPLAFKSPQKRAWIVSRSERWRTNSMKLRPWPL